MSYDLTFLVPKGAEPIPAERFYAYFAGRSHYTLDRSAGQAVYENEATGVYFIFDVEMPVDPEGEDYAGLAFNLNFVRPHVFGLEAESELTALVNHFGLEVDDPQTEGMGRGPYSPEGFLRGWNAGNRFSYQVATRHDVETFALPGAELRRIWEWNRGVEVLQKELGEDVFVPRIMTVISRGRLSSAVTWTEGVPTALPRTDLVVAVRQRRRLFGLLPSATEFVVVGRADLGFAGLPDDGYKVVEPPLAWLREQPADIEKPMLIRLDRVLDTEDLAAARA